MYEFHRKLILKQVKEYQKNYNIDTVVGLMLIDGMAYKDNDIFYNWLKDLIAEFKKININTTYLLLGQAHDFDHEFEKRNIDVKLLKMHYGLEMIKSVDSRRNHGVEYSQYEWNPNTGKFMFFTGEISRPNRIGLLKAFYEKDMLKNSIYSFYSLKSERDKEYVRNYFKEYSDNEYINFLNSTINNHDENTGAYRGYADMTGKQIVDNKVWDGPAALLMVSSPYEEYAQVSIDVITEGWAYPPHANWKYLTQGLFKPMRNRLPFILADHKDRIEYVKSLGFCTFEEFFAIPDYYKIDNWDEKNCAVATNVEYFLKNANKNQSKIRDGVEHNFNICKKIEQQHLDLIDFLNNICVDDSARKFIVPYDFGKYIQIPKEEDVL